MHVFRFRSAFTLVLAAPAAAREDVVDRERCGARCRTGYSPVAAGSTETDDAEADDGGSVRRPTVRGYIYGSLSRRCIQRAAVAPRFTGPPFAA